MKSGRQDRILEIIRDNEVRTQQELAARLRQEGFDVTQATVSRDIKELNLIKTACEQGGYRYGVQGGVRQEEQDRLHRIFARTVLEVRSANNLIVLKTMEGSANTVAVVIDGLNNEDILGCIAGDDTILIVVSGNDKTAEIIGLIEELRGQAEV